MKSLDEVIDGMERCSKTNCFDCNGCPYEDDDAEVGCRSDDKEADALHYLKEYQAILPLVPSLINTAIAVQKKGKTIG